MRPLAVAVLAGVWMLGFVFRLAPYELTTTVALFGNATSPGRKFINRLHRAPTMTFIPVGVGAES
jgi:hypothetical protein